MRYLLLIHVNVSVEMPYFPRRITYLTAASRAQALGMRSGTLRLTAAARFSPTKGYREQALTFNKTKRASKRRDKEHIIPAVKKSDGLNASVTEYKTEYDEDKIHDEGL